jgi:hypothetical protein
MNYYSMEQIARERQNKLVEEGLREARVRWAQRESGQRRFPLRLIRIVGAGFAIIVRQIAITLGF